MKLLLSKFFLITVIVFLSACSSNPNTGTTSGDTGDSASIGAGTDTAGSMVDTGSTVTDTSSKSGL